MFSIFTSLSSGSPAVTVAHYRFELVRYDHDLTINKFYTATHSLAGEMHWSRDINRVDAVIENCGATHSINRIPDGGHHRAEWVVMIRAEGTDTESEA